MLTKEEELYHLINYRPKEAFPDGARFYDDGLRDAEAGLPRNIKGSRSYQDGWWDVFYWGNQC